MILNRLPQQLGAGQLLTTKQELQKIRSRFADIDCGEIDKAIGEWEAFYLYPRTDVGGLEIDLRKFVFNTNAKNWDHASMKSLDERLSLLRTDVTQRQQILREKYEGTEFNEVAAPVIASLNYRLAQLHIQLEQFKQCHAARKRYPYGVALILVGVGFFAAGVWRVVVEEMAKNTDHTGGNL